MDNDKRKFDRTEFLSKKIKSTSNLYKGSLPIKEKHKFAYINNFVMENFFPGVAYDDDIVALTTKEDFIIDQHTLYILFIAGFGVERLNRLKLHLVQNFLVNWDTYDEYIKHISDTELGKISISTLTGKVVYRNGFDHDILTNDQLYSDIQFLILDSNADSFHRGNYDYQILTHIQTRISNGLITVILYTDTEANYLKNNIYDNGLRYLVNIKKEKLGLTKEDAEDVAKFRGVANDETTLKQEDKQVPKKKDKKKDSGTILNDPIVETKKTRKVAPKSIATEDPFTLGGNE